MNELVRSVVVAVLALMPKEQAKELIDALFDKAEDIVKDSSNTIDDAIFLPIIGKLREVLDIPDLPDSE